MFSKINNNIKEFVESAKLVQSETGKTIFQQFNEIRSLKKINPTCGKSDYYSFGIYKETPDSYDKYKRYLGWRSENEISESLNNRNLVTTAADKLLLMLLLEMHGLPYPKLKAIFKDNGDTPEIMGRHLSNEEELFAFLKDKSNYPVFSKPSNSGQGEGAFFLKDFDEKNERILLHNNKSFSIDEFINKSIKYEKYKYYRKEAGYLFQELIQQHPDIERFQGSKSISSIRLIVLVGENGARPLRALWKLAIGDNANDNFSKGKYGNIIAQVDINTGELEYALNKFWPNAKKIYSHPDTDIPFKDFTIPNWDKIIELSKAAAYINPLLKLQHWDIAIGSDGPIFIELNELGACQFMQIFGNGLLDKELVDLLKADGQFKRNSKLRQLIS